jgi:hypothetical protein
MHKIVIVRHQELHADTVTPLVAANAKAFDDVLHDALKPTPGATFSRKPPVPMSGGVATGISGPGLQPAVQLNAMTVQTSPRLYAIEVEFDDEQAVDVFRNANKDRIVGVYANPPIAPFATVCPSEPVGTLRDVKRKVNVLPEYRGQGVRLAVVDTGVNGTLVPVAGGLQLDGFPKPGKSPSGHGTMVAFDTGLAAPDATILDYPLLRTEPSLRTEPQTLSTFLYDALAVYQQLLAEFLKTPDVPMVAVNSWGVADRSEDAPAGSADNYGSNPDHPFNQIVTKLVAAGADVFFAAGNCGGPCPFATCGEKNKGAGNGILGANALPDVITIGAVTVRDELLGYSSSGPGSMKQSPQKPDLVAPSHFEGAGIAAQAADQGTSTACAVAAGVAAALRSMPNAKGVRPAALKAALLQGARQPKDTAWGWNPDTGYGVVNLRTAAEALEALVAPPATTERELVAAGKD